MTKILETISILFLVSFTISFANSAEDAPQAETRILGGNLVPRDHYLKPDFIVYILYFANYAVKPTSDYECTGNIIKPSWIVGMGFCLEFANPSTERLETGIIGRNGTNFVRLITETYHPPGYDSLTSLNNVALAKVDEPFPLDTGELFAAALPDPTWQSDQFTGSVLFACGYRHPYSTANLFTNTATCGIFAPRNRLRCAQFYNDPPIRSNEICAESSDFTKMAVCSRDFGTGLLYYSEENGVAKFQIYAIASYTYPNNCATSPTAFILLAGFLDWINSIAV